MDPNKYRETSRKADRKRKAELNALANSFGFPTWGRFSTFLKKASRSGPIIITVGTGKEKRVLSTKGLAGTAPG